MPELSIEERIDVLQHAVPVDVIETTGRDTSDEQSAAIVTQSEAYADQPLAPVIPIAEHRKLGGLRKAAAVLAATAALAGCGQPQASNEKVQTAKPAVAVRRGAVERTTTTAFVFAGKVEDGSDRAIRIEDDNGLYNCGGKKGETWLNPDGSSKPFTPDYLMKHMNAHPDLAKSDSAFWTGIMSPEAFAFLATHGAGNTQHTESLEVDVKGVDENYSEFLAKQNAVVIEVDAVAGNFACKDAAENYHVFAVGRKALVAGKTHLTGIALTPEDYLKFVKTAADNDGDLSKIFTQEVVVDGKKYVVVLTKHEMCGNNELKLPPAQPNTPDTTTTITVPATNPTTTTTTIGPKSPAHPPVSGGASTTVPAPKPQPNPTPTITPPTQPPATLAPPSTITTQTTAAPPSTQPTRP